MLSSIGTDQSDDERKKQYQYALMNMCIPRISNDYWFRDFDHDEQWEKEQCEKEFGDIAREHLCNNNKCRAFGKGVTLTRCKRCKQVKYCSKKCRRSDWQSHKKFCRKHS